MLFKSKIYWLAYPRQHGFYLNTQSSALTSQTAKKASIGIPQEPKQNEEVLYVLLCTA